VDCPPACCGINPQYQVLIDLLIARVQHFIFRDINYDSRQRTRVYPHNLPCRASSNLEPFASIDSKVERKSTILLSSFSLARSQAAPSGSGNEEALSDNNKTIEKLKGQRKLT
jgi:hypothetical protein